MVDRQFFINNLWRRSAGLPEKEEDKPVNLNELSITEWSTEFESLMRNRLILGALRYGRLKAPGKARYNRVESIIKRMKAYQETGNKEYLVDCANLCLLEYEECHHPAAHFHAVDDGEHVKEVL